MVALRREMTSKVQQEGVRTVRMTVWVGWGPGEAESGWAAHL